MKWQELGVACPRHRVPVTPAVGLVVLVDNFFIESQNSLSSKGP